ncbi:receptor activity-modifying protein 2 isoform X2 [Rhineura floridana]|uniref:receptor activity-modifying protein 2 isoform X2 n=1 Tax=Rhineura floridana TaxID=261503 RepID=UPI002AC81D2F|nr:receptor activity-modifying protein 2 isoform X2 [Rhineura floridana]
MRLREYLVTTRKQDVSVIAPTLCKVGSVRGKEALPVIPIQISGWSGGNGELCRVAGCTKMDGQCLPLLLLLLVFTAIRLDAHPGTTVTPRNTNVSLEGGPNATALGHYPERNITTHYVYSIYAEFCWSIFAHQMANISKAHWCEWRVIGRPYHDLRKCLEGWAEHLKYVYPNALAEDYTILSHSIYFLNCSLENPTLLDPPENVLLALIITPICLIPFLVTLVVLKSKDGEMQS